MNSHELELLNTLRCVDGLTLYFKSLGGEIVAEVLFLDEQGRVERVYAHYSC